MSSIQMRFLTSSLEAALTLESSLLQINLINYQSWQKPSVITNFKTMVFAGMEEARK